MKWTLLLATLLCNAQIGFAGLSDLDFKAEPKCLDRDRSDSGVTKVTTSKWAYDVTLFNKSTKDLTDLEVTYIVFVKDAIVGSKGSAAKLVRKQGVTKVASIKGHDKLTFQTDPVELTKSQLSGGWVYADGARPRATDTLAGIWVRVLQGATQIGEFALPASLATKEKW